MRGSVGLVTVLQPHSQIPSHVLMYSPLEVQPLGFAMLQPMGVYPWQAYMPPGDGLWPMPGVY